jgi:hypothetical protein
MRNVLGIRGHRRLFSPYRFAEPSPSSARASSFPLAVHDHQSKRRVAVRSGLILGRWIVFRP